MRNNVQNPEQKFRETQGTPVAAGEDSPNKAGEDARGPRQINVLRTKRSAAARRGRCRAILKGARA